MKLQKVADFWTITKYLKQNNFKRFQKVLNSINVIVKMFRGESDSV